MTPDIEHLFIRLYTDADVTSDLAPALRRRRYVVESVAEAGNIQVSDEAQLVYAAQRGMAMLTYSAQDFIPLAKKWYLAGREHAGIIISEEFSQREFGELLRRTEKLLASLTAEEIKNTVRFLEDFEEK